MSNNDYKIVSIGDILSTIQNEGTKYEIREVTNRKGETWYAVYIDGKFDRQFPTECAANHSIMCLVKKTKMP